MCLCNARDRRDRQEMRDTIGLLGSFGLSGFFGPIHEIIETNQTDQTNEIDHLVPPVSQVSRHGPWPLSCEREGQGQATTPLRPASLALRGVKGLGALPLSAASISAWDAKDCPANGPA